MLEEVTVRWSPARRPREAVPRQIAYIDGPQAGVPDTKEGQGSADARRTASEQGGDDKDVPVARRKMLREAF
jgi:hypothetical protein